MGSINYIMDKDFRRKALLLIVALSSFAVVGCKDDDRTEISSDISLQYAPEQTIEEITEVPLIYGQSMQEHYSTCDGLMKQTWAFENSKNRDLMVQAIDCMNDYENRYIGTEGYKSLNTWKSTLEVKLQRL